MILGERGHTVEGIGFEAYVRGNSERLLRLAWLITRDWEDAGDACQDALAALYPRWVRLPEPPALDAYVSRSVVHACYAVVRRRRSVPTAEETLEVHAPPTADPAEMAASLQQQRELWRLVGTLPATQQAAVVLRYYEDLPFAQVAAVLGCRESTARSHVRRALRTLGSLLAKEGL